MPKNVLFIPCAIAFGCGLAVVSIYTVLPVGWIGGLGLIGWTLVSRRRWAKLQATTGLEPGGPERKVRFNAVGIALLFGHSVIGYAFPEIDLHVGNGNFLAIDSWTMIVAMFIASFIFQQDKKIQDERDVSITARGTKAGYLTLITLLVVSSLALGVLPPRYIPTLSYFVLGNIQITVILASLLVKFSVQLIEYAKDTDAAFANS